jgi:hypothetical protein
VVGEAGPNTCRTSRSVSDLSRLYWDDGMPVTGQSSPTTWRRDPAA